MSENRKGWIFLTHAVQFTLPSDQSGSWYKKFTIHYRSCTVVIFSSDLVST